MALISDYKKFDKRTNRYPVKTARNYSPGRQGDDTKYKKGRFELFLKEVYELIIDLMVFMIFNIVVCVILLFTIYVFLHRHMVDRKYGVV